MTFWAGLIDVWPKSPASDHAPHGTTFASTVHPVAPNAMDVLLKTLIPDMKSADDAGFTEVGVSSV